MLNQNLEDQSLFLCRYISFMAYFSMQTSAWILTVITIDRYLIIWSTNWMQKYSKSMKFSLIVIFTIILFFALINFPVALLNGKINKLSNSTHEKKVLCYSTSYIIFWQKFSLLFECIFPLIIMIIFNILLVKRTYKSSTKFRNAIQNSSKSKSNHQKSYSGFINVSPKESQCQNSFNDDERRPIRSRQNFVLKSRLAIPDNGDSLLKSSKLLKSDNSIQNHLKHSSSIKNKPHVNREIKFLEVALNNTENGQLTPYKMETISSYEEETISVDSNIYDKNDSLANLNFLKFGNVSMDILNYAEPSETNFLKPSPSDLMDQNSNNLINNGSNESCKNVGLEKKHNTANSNGHSERKVSNLRNRRIVVMLSLLTLSFTISTVPSSIFYTFFRPIINDKPYKRLFTLIFNLVRHLSHTFNFVIYFTSSSVIKRELKEAIREFREGKLFSKECFFGALESLKRCSSCIVCFLPLALKKITTRNDFASKDANEKVNNHSNNNIKAESFEKNKVFRLRTNSIISINQSDSNSEESSHPQKEVFTRNINGESKLRKTFLKGEQKDDTILESSL